MAGKSYKQEVMKGKFSDFMDGAYSDLQELSSELDEWASNMEGGNLGNTDKCSRVREAADTLGNHTDAPGMVDGLDEEEVSVAVSVPRSQKNGTSRAVRLENIVSTLDSLISFADEQKDALEESELVEKEETHDLIDEIENLISQLETTKDEIEGVEIPGMYG